MIASGETMTSAKRTLPGPLRTDLSVTGMTCQNCARHVRESLQGVPGVAQASVDLDAGSASIRWSPEAQPNVASALSALSDAGYEAKAVENRGTAEMAKPSLWKGWGLNLVVGVPVTFILVLGEWAFGLAMESWFRWLAFALATLVQALCGARFYRGAWMQLKAGSSNMDTLVALGSTTAYAYSIWALFHGTHAYFMEAAAIITLISVGHWLEARMSVRAAGSMKKLLALAPAQARRRTANGSEEIVDVADLQVGDTVVLRPGDRLPTDGVVLEGSSSVDESMLTGESMPVDKSTGSLLYGGTVNLNSGLIMQVKATGDATALAQIIAAVERAQTSRANIQRLGDRVSSVFVPVVILIALLAGLWWGLAPESARHTAELLSKYLWPVHFQDTVLALAIVHAAAVLIIACPCAMGLATPVAIMAGTNAAAERGILIRDGIALEKAGTITTVVFDKTGTLTNGKPTLAAFRSLIPGQVKEASLLQMAAEVARQSNHPLSQAIASEADRKVGRDPAVAISNWREIRGAGLEALANGASIRLGSPLWLSQSGINLTTAQPFIDEWTATGATVVAMAVNDEVAVLLSLQDTIKPDAEKIVRNLQTSGYVVHLVTGDNKRTAAAIGAKLGIGAGEIAAEVRPEDKAAFVSGLQQRGQHVAFVGDGINDAPALEQADLGIAVGRASDVAQMAADIVLLKSDVHAIPESLGLARATLRAIKQNLFWAFFYNAAGIPLAALGFLSPVLCALTMGLSDVVVIGNALRLKRWRIR